MSLLICTTCASPYQPASMKSMKGPPTDSRVGLAFTIRALRHVTAVQQVVSFEVSPSSSVQCYRFALPAVLLKPGVFQAPSPGNPARNR